MKQKQLIMHGNISVSSKSNKEATIVLVPKQRVLCIEKNEVKSFNRKNTEDISREIKPFGCEPMDTWFTQALMTTDDGDVKIFNFSDVRSTTNNGKKTLELTVSTDKIEGYGAAAADALSLSDLPNQVNVTITIKTNTPALEDLVQLNLENFKTLSTAIKGADLDAYPYVKGLLDGTTEYTFFPPYDNAFRKLPFGTVQELLKPENKPKLQKLLADHVVKGKLSASDIKKKKYLKTVRGKRLKVDVNADGTVFVGGARIVTPDGRMSNGYVHTVNRVLGSR
jgi:uncharacterized surface protein with fasciclin (FAS1) repeats